MEPDGFYKEKSMGFQPFGGWEPNPHWMFLLKGKSIIRNLVHIVEYDLKDNLNK
jgi:hypothetical protein